MLIVCCVTWLASPDVASLPGAYMYNTGFLSSAVGWRSSILREMTLLFCAFAWHRSVTIVLPNKLDLFFGSIS